MQEAQWLTAGLLEARITCQPVWLAACSKSSGEKQRQRGCHVESRKS